MLKRAPNRLGANHCYIHTVEASSTPERSLRSADRLRTLAPAAGHLVHMPAHIFARTGDHAAAAQANLSGAEADRVYLKQAPPDSFYVLAYYSHNLHFLADSDMMQGRFGEAQKAAAELAERLLPHTDMMPMIHRIDDVTIERKTPCPIALCGRDETYPGGRPSRAAGSDGDGP